MKTSIITIIVSVLFVSSALFAEGDSILLEKGSKAPDFSLVSSDGDTVTLGRLKGKNSVVLIFYPGDETPGCTKQLCAVRDDYAGFKAKNVVVFGVNQADSASHKKFINRYSFPFPLLVDAKGAVARDYGCYGWPFVKRTVFVINREGVVVYAKRGMPSTAEILNAIPE